MHQDDLKSLGEEDSQVAPAVVDLLLHRAAVKLRQRTQSTVRVISCVTFHTWLAWAAIDPRGPKHQPGTPVCIPPPETLSAAKLRRTRYVIMPMQHGMHKMHKYYRTCVLVQPGMFSAVCYVGERYYLQVRWVPRTEGISCTKQLMRTVV